MGSGAWCYACGYAHDHEECPKEKKAREARREGYQEGLKAGKAIKPKPSAEYQRCWGRYKSDRNKTKNILRAEIQWCLSAGKFTKAGMSAIRDAILSQDKLGGQDASHSP
jgi:hypothetical protein